MGNDDTYVNRGLTQEVRSSPREIDHIRQALTRAGAERVMVLCGQNVLHKSDVVTRVQDALGDLFVGRFEGAVPHSPVDVVEAARDMAQDLHADTLVSVGGGSSLTIAKGAALLASTAHELADYRVRLEPPNTVIPPSIPLPEVKLRTVAVATTMGCAELGPSGGGFTSRGKSEKIIVFGNGSTSPKLILIDGAALATSPPSVQKSTAIGQLRIAIEGVISTSHNPLSEAVGLSAMSRLNRELSAGWQQDPEYLLRVKAACCLGTYAYLAAGALAVNTAMAHQIGAICDVPHGVANAILLPHTIRFNAVAGASQLQLVAKAFELDPDRSAEHVAAAIADRVASLCAGLEIPSRLRDVGVSPDQFEAIALATLGDHLLSGNPTPVHGPEAIVGILERAW